MSAVIATRRNLRSIGGMRALLGLGLFAAAACTGPTELSDAGFDAGTDGGSDGGVSVCAPAATGVAANDPYRRARTTADQPDDTPDTYQFHILYVEPSDRTASAPLDTNGTLRRSVTAFNAWFENKSGGSRLRFDTCEGLLDVTYVKLPSPYTEAPLATGVGYTPPEPVRLLDRLSQLLSPQFNDPKKLYLVYWDGLMLGACGGAPHPPELVFKFAAMFVGGVYQSSYLTSAASAGATSVSVYSTSALPLPTTPFTATLGTETVTVTQVVSNTAQLSVPLASAHPLGEVLLSSSSVSACRSNPFSSNGSQLNYSDYVGVHESIHALGFVPTNAPHWMAGGHVSTSGPSGTADVMWSGSVPSICFSNLPHNTAAQSTCVLDSTHQEYFKVPSSSGILDLAKSAFLDPTPEGAAPPPGW